jgi:lysophospholipase L1-like esterase
VGLRPLLTRHPAIAIAALLAVSAAAPVLAASPASAASVASSPAASSARYVALGDSYSAGLGAGHEIASGGACDRSRVAYSALFARAVQPASYVSVACSGATTNSMVKHQVGALSKSTTLVSLTIGGNDVGFEHVLQTCILSSDAKCARVIAAAGHAAAHKLPGHLLRVLAAIRAAAPAAKVVVLGYPQLFDLSRPACVEGLSHIDEVHLNQAAAVLDATIAAAARKSGDVFGSVRGTFTARHRLCGGASWIHGIAFFNLDESFHPTVAGQALGYLPVFTKKAA